ncbi:mycothiol synthase [Knoellia sp. 3-2P3]|uniref:mycothiol synthase n=1 Tax=unclassified Knoellia TaxID=2618719 RepID=UPI0023D9875A|nr:mycothiol synthase [Knoellia sp. 3-2P3]MDF2091635.1 mycothiol synthase [Knoellia sp. 3-2P3]
MSSSARPAPSTLAMLSPQQADEVRALAARAAEGDGVAALSEQTLLSLTAPEGTVEHVLAYAAGRLTGYAQAAGGEDASVELVVDPAARRHGVGSALWAEVARRHPRARVWAHGDLGSARRFAAALGLEPVRELHKMSRPLTADDATGPVAEAATALPPGFTARAFVPGRDEQAWLETNAAAFADHPEQGRLTHDDLRERMAQPWFDPAGFIIVEAEGEPGRVAAFHWTKVDPEQRSALDPAATAGEVYVVGVHPAYQGRGLARPLTALGLAHLAGLGLPEVVLYVDGDNAGALRTYTSIGFRSTMVDVMYSHTVDARVSG